MPSYRRSGSSRATESSRDDGSSSPRLKFADVAKLKIRANRAKARNRAASHEWAEERIPSERTKFQAFIEFLNGKWIHAHIVYDDFPGDREKDLEDFQQGQANLGLVGALFLTIDVSFIIEIAQNEMLGPHGSIAGAVFTLILQGSTLLTFMSVAFSVLNLMFIRQADADSEAYNFMKMTKRQTALPFLALLYGLLFLGADVLVYIYVITGMPDVPQECEYANETAGEWEEGCIPFPADEVVFYGACIQMGTMVAFVFWMAISQLQKLYLAKRRYKLANLAFMNLEERPMSEFIDKGASKKGTIYDYPETELAYQFRLQVGLSAKKIAAELEAFVQHLDRHVQSMPTARANGLDGFTFFDQDKFTRYIFRKYKPQSVSADEENLCVFSEITLKRIEDVLEAYVSERSKSEAEKAIAGLHERLSGEQLTAPPAQPRLGERLAAAAAAENNQRQQQQDGGGVCSSMSRGTSGTSRGSFELSPQL